MHYNIKAQHTLSAFSCFLYSFSATAHVLDVHHDMHGCLHLVSMKPINTLN